MRRPWSFVLAIVILSGCAAAAPASSSPGPSLAASPTAAPTPAPSSTVPAPPATDAPTETPVAPPTYGPCPTVSPMSVATYTAANPTCFGSSDVTLVAWEEIPSGADYGMTDQVLHPTWFNEPAWSVLVDGLNGTCGESDMCEPYLWVFLDPARKLRFETDGLYVEVTGHRGDPAAKSCYATFTDPAEPTLAPGIAAGECASDFVLTSIKPVPPPAGALTCPTAVVLTVAQYATTDPACFHGRTISIVGWSDAPPAVDFGGTTTNPAWLQGGSLGTLWTEKPTVADGNGQCDSNDCRWMFVAANPALGLSLGKSPGWFIVTGHIDDPAAEQCGTGDSVGAAVNRAGCRAAFVATAVKATTAPG